MKRYILLAFAIAAFSINASAFKEKEIQVRSEKMNKDVPVTVITPDGYKKNKENPNPFLDRIECIPTIKEHLSEDELIRLAETPCEEDVLRRVFLFLYQ